MHERVRKLSGVLLVALLCGMTRAQQPNVGALQVFPPDNPWNWDISGHAVHPNSANFIGSIGGGAALRADFSFEINTVSGGPTTAISFIQYPGESDPGPGFNFTGSGSATGNYRMPAVPRIEGGSGLNPPGDAHCICVDTTNMLLYETYHTNASTTPWQAGCGAVYDLTSNALRTDGWTSADAAGLPIFPGLLRYEEIVAGNIPHALRVTAPTLQPSHLYPARHTAGGGGANDPPLGLRLRLKAGTNISGFSGTPRVVLEALKRYGLFVADQGTGWYISTTVDSRWQADTPYVNDALAGIAKFLGSDMEAVLTVDAGGNPIPPSGALAAGGGGGGGGGCGATGFEAFVLLSLLYALRPLIRSGAP